MYLVGWICVWKLQKMPPSLGLQKHFRSSARQLAGLLSGWHRRLRSSFFLCFRDVGYCDRWCKLCVENLYMFFSYVFTSCRSIMLKKMHLAVQDARSGCTWERNRGHGGFSKTIQMKSCFSFSFTKVYWLSRIHFDFPPFKPATSLRHSTWPRPRVRRCQNCSGSMWHSNSTLHLLWQWTKNCRALAAPT